MKDGIVCHQTGKDPLYKTWHASTEHLIMYFYSNGGSIVCAEDVFPIKKGGLVFIAADTYHYTMPDVPEIYDRSKLNISCGNLNKILDLLGENNRFKAFSDKAIVYAEIDEKEQKELDGIFNESLASNTDDERELLLFSCCIKLLFYLDKYSKASTFSVKGIMDKAICYINKNISDDINIDSICAAVNISKYHFCRQFKKYTGMTVMKYILKTRLVLAKNDLKKTNLSISAISEKYGFSSFSYFSRVFKEEEHCSPLQYRKRPPL
ncbi:MAG: helix-turn-helix transcriptional regulator [Clostridia bacterium]|nr:helix-turn-helix transcriptional regulator [Clostridia bacterium]